MDHILQKVVGSTRISLLDGFSGYNHILVHPNDQAKTAFITPSGTFMYVKMPFVLMNERATFQRAMDIAFAKEIHDFLLIYLDDITVFSKSDNQHLDHLRQVWIRRRKFTRSYNFKRWYVNRPCKNRSHFIDTTSKEHQRITSFLRENQLS